MESSAGPRGPRSGRVTHVTIVRRGAAITLGTLHDCKFASLYDQTFSYGLLSVESLRKIAVKGWNFKAVKQMSVESSETRDEVHPLLG